MAEDTIKTNGTTATTNPSATAGAETGIHAEEAKSRFNAALEEAKAGVQELKEEAVTRANAYRDQAKEQGDNWTSDVSATASDLAEEGKAKASGALVGLSRLVDENASRIDDNFGPQYGDYARSASRSIMETAETLDRKSVQELGDDVRAFVREQPVAAVGIAALAGFAFARLFRK